MDLWPQDFESVPRERAPVTILKEQASLLGRKTRNLLEGEVVQVERVHPNGPEFTYRFIIVAPALGDYRYGLFTISHDISLYPVTFRVDEDIKTELAAGSMSHGDMLTAEDEDELVKLLRQILASKKTQRVIAALLNQMLS